MALPKIEQRRKPGRQRHVDGSPAQRFAKTDGVAGAMKDAQVQRQHAEHEQIEENPEVEQWEILATWKLLIVDF